MPTTQTRKALLARGLQESLVDEIMDRGLTVTELLKLGVSDLKGLFSEDQVLTIWEKVVTPKVSGAEYDKEYHSLRTFLRPDGKDLKEKRRIQKATDRFIEVVCETLEQPKRILVFFGNGISEERVYDSKREETVVLDKSLSSSYIVVNYLKDIADSKPRDFQKKKERLKKLSSLMGFELEMYGMLDFMDGFSRLEEIRDGFMDHVIRTCAKAEPNANHYQLFLFLLILRLTNAKNRLRLFTTNYDNLLEKAYLELQPTLRGLTKEKRERRRYVVHGPSLYGRERIQLDRPDVYRLRPRYVMSTIGHKSDRIPIVPIHGSIRVSRCEECDRVLNTQAAAVGAKCCVYCGADVPSVILPTTEGQTDKKLLRMLEKEVKESEIILIIGYGFDDPHIFEKMNRGLEASKGKKTIVNICESKIDPERIDIGGNELIEIGYFINQSLERVNLDVLRKLNLSPTPFRDQFPSLWRDVFPYRVRMEFPSYREEHYELDE